PLPTPVVTTPTVGQEIKKEPPPPLPTPVVTPPVLRTEVKKEPPPPVIPPPTVGVEPKKMVPALPVVGAPGYGPPRTDTVRSFVRLSAAASITPVEITPGPGAPINPPVGIAPPSDAPKLSRDALLNLQTPTVTVEKRGPTSLRAGETQLYHLVVRNHSPIAAQ